jgi:hypothetical protein
MSAREAYIAGRSGGSRPPKQTSPSSTQGNRQQEREQQAYDAGRQERERAQTIQQQGITGLSQDQREQARSIAEQTGKDPYDTKSQIAPGGGIIASKQAPIDKFNEFMTTVVDTGNIRFPSFNPIFGAIQGFQNTNQVLKKLSEGSKLNSNDKITVFNLYNDLPLDDLQNLVEKYAKDNKVDSNDIFSNFNDTLSNLENLVEDQQDYLDMYFDRMDKMGLGDTIKTMAGDLTGTRNIEKGTTTLQDLTKPADEGGLGTEGLQFLKVTNPQAYYRLRPNDPDLANESFVSTGDRVADRRFNAKIMEARAEAMDRQSRQDVNMAQASPAFAPPTAPAPGTPAPTPAPPIFPGFPGTPTPGLPPGTPTTPVATNYSNLPTYTQLGIPTFLGDPRFAQFRETLNLFPRV